MCKVECGAAAIKIPSGQILSELAHTWDLTNRGKEKQNPRTGDEDLQLPEAGLREGAFGVGRSSSKRHKLPFTVLSESWRR